MSTAQTYVNLMILRTLAKNGSLSVQQIQQQVEPKIPEHSIASVLSDMQFWSLVARKNNQFEITDHARMIFSEIGGMA